MVHVTSKIAYISSVSDYNFKAKNLYPEHDSTLSIIKYSNGFFFINFLYFKYTNVALLVSDIAVQVNTTLPRSIFLNIT